MPHIITIQYPYESITITLSDNQTIVAHKIITKFKAISDLLPTLQAMLSEHNLTLADIACIGVNIGPGPFNTLRSIIATVNAIAFALKTPLIACNGLQLLAQSYPTENTVAILDAFGQDVYFYITSTQEQGYDSIENLCKKVQTLPQEKINFIGNAACKHRNIISKMLDQKALINDQVIFASPQSLVDTTAQQFADKKVEQELFPLYFASPVVKN